MTTEKILNTLETYDIGQTTVTIGSAAIAMHLAEAGIHGFPAEDVDVLCSSFFFAQQSRAVLCVKPDTIQKFQIRFPYGESQSRALSPTLDIYPGQKTENTVLPFSASTALGGQWHPTTYEDCLGRPKELIEYSGYKFLSMAEVLLWTAKAGRKKDITKVDTLLPVSSENDLITDQQLEIISTERDLSVHLREQFPDRHHARVPS